MCGFFFLLPLVALDGLFGFVVCEPHLLFGGLLAGGGQLLELVHDEGGGDACGDAGDDSAKDVGMMPAPKDL